MNRDEEPTRRSTDANDKPDADEEAVPPNPDGPRGVIGGAALGGPPAVAVGQAIEGDDWRATDDETEAETEARREGDR
jgi:hypothetical protein